MLVIYFVSGPASSSWQLPILMHHLLTISMQLFDEFQNVLSRNKVSKYYDINGKVAAFEPDRK